MRNSPLRFCWLFIPLVVVLLAELLGLNVPPHGQYSLLIKIMTLGAPMVAVIVAIEARTIRQLERERLAYERHLKDSLFSKEDEECNTVNVKIVIVQRGETVRVALKQGATLSDALEKAGYPRRGHDSWRLWQDGKPVKKSELARPGMIVHMTHSLMGPEPFAKKPQPRSC